MLKHFALLALLVSAAFAGCNCEEQYVFVPGNLNGKVCHPDTGIGLPGATVRIKNSSSGSERESLADQNGEYAFPRVSVGTYTVTAVLDQIERSFEVSIKSQETAILTDTACRTGPGEPDEGVLAGQVCNRHTGDMVSLANVVVQTSNGDLLAERTNENGEFEIAGVPVGEHVVSIDGDGYQRAFLVEINAGETTVLDLAEGCEVPSASEGGVVGSFCNPTTGGNLVGADVVVSPMEGAGETVSDITDTAGEFLVNGLAPGFYRVDISHADFSFTEVNVEIEAGQFATVTDPSTCGERPEFGRIEGLICNDSAGGLFDGSAQLFLGLNPVRDAVDIRDGEFAFNGVEPGTYDLTATAADGGYVRRFTGIVVEPFRTAFIQEFNCPQPEDICSEVVNNPSVSSDGRIFLVVDRSGSMGETDSNGQQKWSVMRNALINVTSSLDSAVEFGLMTFPQGDVCGAGTQQVALGPNTAGAIANRLQQINPDGGTPTAPTLTEAREIITPFANDGRPLAVLLATDGGPNCENGQQTFQTSSTCRCTNPGQQGNCQLQNCLDVENDGDGPVTEIGRIRDMGVKTFVIGVTGIENFADVLNNMAVAGGTDLPGATKYYEANDQAQLQQALDEITQRVLACRVDVGADITNASSVTVRVGDQVLARDPARQNGWDQTTPTTVELFGSACDVASASGAQPVVVQTCFAP